MYIDESGGTDEVVTSEDVTVTVDGQDYEAELNTDLDDDGVNDTAVITDADGGARAYIDSDTDGQADRYVEVDSEGHVVTEAAYDAGSGDWVAGETGAATPSDDGARTSTAGPMTADLPGGQVEIGPATVDTDHDGVDDTAVVDDQDGTTYHFTDVDGDGDADVALVIGPDGSTTTLEHQGEGRWVESSGDPGESRSGVGDAEWGGALTQPVEGVARIDSTTGLWISQN